MVLDIETATTLIANALKNFIYQPLAALLLSGYPNGASNLSSTLPYVDDSVN